MTFWDKRWSDGRKSILLNPNYLVHFFYRKVASRWSAMRERIMNAGIKRRRFFSVDEREVF